MKKLLIAVFALLLVTGATAATVKPHLGGMRDRDDFGGGKGRTTVIVGGGYGGYAPLYNPYFGMGLGYGYGMPWYGYGYPYYDYGYGYNARPSKLDQEIMDIQHDYAQKINSARADDSMTGRERRATIRELKLERDQAISNAKKNYYKQGTTSYNNQPTYYNGYKGGTD